MIKFGQSNLSKHVFGPICSKGSKVESLPIFHEKQLPPSRFSPLAPVTCPAVPELDTQRAVAGDDQTTQPPGQMAPKKKQPVSKQKHKPKPSAPSSSSSAAPRLEISSENERRLRQLLLNSSTASAPSPAPLDAPTARSESREQKGRRLRGVYDKLALEGFSSSQIEQALSAIPVSTPKRIHNPAVLSSWLFIDEFCCWAGYGDV